MRSKSVYAPIVDLLECSDCADGSDYDSVPITDRCRDAAAVRSLFLVVERPTVASNNGKLLTKIRRIRDRLRHSLFEVELRYDDVKQFRRQPSDQAFTESARVDRKSLANMRSDDDVPRTFDARNINCLALLENSKVTGELDTTGEFAKKRQRVPLKIAVLFSDTSKLKELVS